MANRIEKQIELPAPVSRVWRALTDYREFGEWFRVKLNGPFVLGEVSDGYLTVPGYEHLRWSDIDYTKETPTLVEFRLEKTATGTLLRLTESGFENVPANRRAEAFRMNEGGWEAQMKNIEHHVASSS